MNRRSFLKYNLAAGISLTGCISGCGKRPISHLYKISLTEWSLNRSLFSGIIQHLDFPSVAKQEVGLNAVEYVNQFFMDKAEDKSYLAELKKRCDDLGVKSVLIMCDNEGRIGDPDATMRKQSVENHYKWITAAQFLGCHSIRVNAYSEGSAEEQQKLVAEGLYALAEFGNDHNVSVLVENHGGNSSNGKWLAGLMKRVRHSRVGTLPDLGNFRISENEFYDRYLGVEELMPYARGLSAKSGEFSQSGIEVRTDFLRMMRIVAKSGYRGYVGIEYSGSSLSEKDGIAATKKLLERIHQQLLSEYPLFNG
jgi:sugar phosphate isomerase/epimerase